MTKPNQSTSYVELDGKDLPAYCPNPNMPIWSSHPRVYIPVDDNLSAQCPYCGTVYKVKSGTMTKGH